MSCTKKKSLSLSVLKTRQVKADDASFLEEKIFFFNLRTFI